MSISPPTSKSQVLNGHATPDNIDYNDIKHLIKLRTTQRQGQARPIPGSHHETKTFNTFENELYHELHDQHQRIDLFVRSKTGEIARRLGTCPAPSSDGLADLASSQPIWTSKLHNWKFEASPPAVERYPLGGWRNLPSSRRLH